jgi:hypothetical protein
LKDENQCRFSKVLIALQERVEAALIVGVALPLLLKAQQFVTPVFTLVSLLGVFASVGVSGLLGARFSSLLYTV